VGLREVPLTIRTGSGERHFRVTVADTIPEQEKGLMFVRSLAPDSGMVFPYNPPQEVGFWMKNTLIPLDMIFVGADGRIIRIATAQPETLDTVWSGGPAAAVLEINGGRAAQLGIRAGDEVSWPH
jgi:uncharacterized membrane protein (UPF0127 family)